MTTADTVRERALNLALADIALEDAVKQLLECCASRRVPMVLAHQQLLQDRDAESLDEVMNRAVRFIEETIERLPADG